VKVLVTGAAGFVGRVLVQRLLMAGHGVIGTHEPAGSPAPVEGLEWVPLDLCDQESVGAALNRQFDAVVHLAALASGAEARKDPGRAWEVNAAGTARLAEALGERQRSGEDALLLLVSTAEVYGAGSGAQPRTEDDPLVPLSPYAASKLGAEVAVDEVARRTGLRAIVARPFPHTGAGQTETYVIPAFARRLRTAREIKAPVVKTGNLEPVRDILDVRDVADAYIALLARGTPGERYNIASGTGHSLREIFFRLAELLQVRAVPETDAHLARGADLAHLVGDPTRLRAVTGWSPRISFDQTLQDVVNAQAD
jgi:GDP-4-dehydro-6-deoxy-D-mannose reductase